MCRERIARRGTHHLSLLPGQNLFRVIDGFASSWQPLEAAVGDVVRLDMTQDQATMLRALLRTSLSWRPRPRRASAQARCWRGRRSGGRRGRGGGARAVAWHEEEQLAFYGIDLGCLDDMPLPPALRDAIASGALQMQDQHHVTLAYVARAEPAALAVAEQVKALAGHRVPVRVRAVAWDARAAALVVEHALPTTAAVSHVTLALAAGERGAYSNDMLRGPHEEQPVADIELTGVVMPFFTY